MLLIPLTSQAAEKTTIRLGVLAFGTVNWELSALQNAQLDASSDFKLQIQALANPQAGKIALQSGAVDMIVSDWIWVSRLRTQGNDFTFYPYSNTAGALVLAKNSPIKNLKDLVGKKLGIAGGELDKNWLLLQALIKHKDKISLNDTVEKVFAAPPLLNQQLKQNRIDAIMNYWHFAARLEAQGHHTLINGQQILHGLGIAEQVPTLGYVFKQSWGEQHKTAVNQFLATSRQAKDLLCTDNEAWQNILPLTKTKDIASQNNLRQHYCQGRILHWGIEEQQAAGKIYRLLRDLSHNRLTGDAENLHPSTFWSIK